MRRPEEIENDPLTERIIGAAIDVNKRIGSGLLESAYQVFLCHELRRLGFEVSNQPGMPVTYDGIRLELGFRPDIIVEKKVIIELKAVPKILPVHEAQLLTYLRLSEMGVGLLINFHAMPFRQGIRRIVY